MKGEEKAAGWKENQKSEDDDGGYQYTGSDLLKQTPPKNKRGLWMRWGRWKKKWKLNRKEDLKKQEGGGEEEEREMEIERSKTLKHKHKKGWEREWKEKGNKAKETLNG